MKLYIAAVFLAVFLADQCESAESKLENWYTYWGIGAVSLSYPEELEEVLDLFEDFPGVTRITASLDLFGFYWPIQDRYLLGGVINTFVDRFEVDSEGLNITGATYGLSLLYFPQRHIGQGFFIRSDVGPALFLMTSDDSTVDETSEWGVGGLVGAGWSQPITSGTRLTFQINSSLRRVEGDSVGAINFTLGGLF